jgi:type VI secretion system Hcp family effector
MKKMIRLLGVFLLTGNFATAYAAGFIQFEGIEGDSIVDGYENWSEFISVVQEITPADVTTGVVSRSLGYSEFKEVSIVKALDRASPKIALRALQGKILAFVTIEWTRNIDGIEKPYYRYEMELVSVKQYTSKGFGDKDLESAKDNQIVEKIFLDFEKITVTYFEYDDAGNQVGTVGYQWDN